MTRPKDWTAGSVAVAVAAACVAVGAGWALWAVSPVAAALTTTHAGLAGLCVLAATRNLRARLEATQQVVDAWNSSEARDELAKSPAAGTPTVQVYDQDAVPVYSTADFGVPDPTMHVYEVGTGRHLCCDDPPVDLNQHVITLRPEPVTARSRVVPGGSWRGFGPEDIQFGDQPESLDYPLPETGSMYASLPYQHPLKRALGIAAQPMTAAETDRLIANLQALPDATLTVNGTFDAGPDINGQVCAVCGKPADGALTERTLDGDGWGELVTFLCDDHYAAAMAEDGDRD